MKKMTLFFCVLGVLLAMISFSGCTNSANTVESPFKNTYTIGESMHTGTSVLDAENDALIQLDESRTLWKEILRRL